MNPRVRDLLEKDMSVLPLKAMEEDDIKTSHSCMPAVITLALLVINAFASVGPMVAGVKEMGGSWQSMWATLLVGAVAYFISSTRQSAIKTDTIANLKDKQ